MIWTLAMLLCSAFSFHHDDGLDDWSMVHLDFPINRRASWSRLLRWRSLKRAAQPAARQEPPPFQRETLLR
jgi:hypothetical protein